MIWKSNSSSGREYFDIVRGLEFESYVCQLCVILICAIILLIYLSMRCEHEILKYWGFLLWVQPLLRTN